MSHQVVAEFVLGNHLCLDLLQQDRAQLLWRGLSQRGLFIREDERNDEETKSYLGSASQTNWSGSSQKIRGKQRPSNETKRPPRTWDRPESVKIYRG